jgi:hypothetical protein
MYWCDAHAEVVETSDLLGLDRKMLISLNTEADPFGVTTQGNFVYWTDWNIRGVHRSTKTGANYTALHQDFFSGLNDIKFFNKSQLPSGSIKL